MPQMQSDVGTNRYKMSEVQQRFSAELQRHEKL
jgi:hypothetical protein